MKDRTGLGTRSGPISLDDLIALNDEIVALTRSGMPLERGLLGIGADLPGRLRSITTNLGERMNRGESLPEALSAAGDGVPRVYRAVVEAGLRSGRLPLALEGMATYARTLAEARRAIGLALWYPLLVLSLAYVLFVFLTTIVVPRFVGMFASLQMPVFFGLRFLAVAGETASYWGPILPLGLALFLAGWWTTRRAIGLDRGRSPGLIGWFPWVRGMMARFESASFAELLALLIEHQVPYHEALGLAGDASGNPALARSGHALALAVQQGRPLAEALQGKSAFPPVLRWVLATGTQQGDLTTALRQLSARYRWDARHRAEKLRVLLPTFLLFGIGATATLGYALAVFVPLTTLWNGLTAQAP